jgi:hypothetical protein
MPAQQSDNLRKLDQKLRLSLTKLEKSKEPTMTVSVFVGTSVDGFIARPNGDLDFLPAGGGEPHGYDEFMAGIDALVIGRKTFETVLSYATWPYGDKRVVVLSSRPVDYPALAVALWNKWPALRLILFRNSLLVVPITSTSTEGSRFKDSCAQASSNVSLSLVFLCSSETGFLSSAPYSAICGSFT